jgi:hypothetical protein
MRVNTQVGIAAASGMPGRKVALHVTALAAVASGLLFQVGCAAADPVNRDVSLTIAGKGQQVRGTVSCTSHAGGDALEVGHQPGGIFVQFHPESLPVVGGVDLGSDVAGKKLTLDSDQPSSISRVNGGNYDYDIVGQVIPQDQTDKAPPQPFELKIKCPR